MNAPLSRAARIRAWLTNHGPGPYRDLIAHMHRLEGGDKERLSKLVHVQLQQLHKVGKVSRTGNARSGYLYGPTATTNRDGRLKANTGKPKPAPKAKPKPNGGNGTTAHLAPRPRMVTAPRPRRQPPITDIDHAAHESLSADVATFVAGGGRIQRLAPHASANPLRHDYSGAEATAAPSRPRRRVTAKAGAP